MDKKLAIELLGGSAVRAAALLQVTPSAVSQWPEKLPRRLADRVLGAAVRHGVDVRQHMQAAEQPDSAEQTDSHA